MKSTGRPPELGAEAREIVIQPDGGEQPPGDRHVVVIGINRYQDKRIRPLKFARDDALAMQEVLINHGGVDRSRITCLLDDEASLARIRDVLADELPRRVGTNDAVIIYFAGHGSPVPSLDTGPQDGLEKYLIPYDANLEKLRADGIGMVDIEKWLGWLKAKQVILLLDCCYSGAAGGRTVLNPGFSMRSNLTGEFLDKLGGKGRFILTACDVNEVALESTEHHHGLFTHYLTLGLQGAADRDGDGLVAVGELYDYVYDEVTTAARELGGTMTPLKRGSVGGKFYLTVPIESPKFSTVAGDDFPNAVDAGFVMSPNAVHCLVVTSELSRESPTHLQEADQAIPIEQHVRRAWEEYGDQIDSAIRAYRPVDHSANADDESETLSEGRSKRICYFCVDEAFRSENALKRAVAALCRADVAVFDVTGFQPGTMLLLGVRSVARRGVTVCSLGGDFVEGSELTVPFNLQALNLAFHSRAQEEKGSDPLHLLGQRIANGFRELAGLPHYLDLPAYDSVRRLGLNSEAYRSVPYGEKILFLCPYSREYTRENWNRYLTKELPGGVRRRIRDAGNTLVTDYQATLSKPVLVRLLDTGTPRLVAQTLYESIRLIDMCVIDWTGLRPNVMYELGVRIAVNPLGAVHIIEMKDAAPVIPEDAPTHWNDMMALFRPIDYECLAKRTDSYDRMIEDFERSLDLSSRGTDYQIYHTVGVSLDNHVQPLVPVAEELVRSANLLASDDNQSTGIAPVLYHDVNKKLSEAAESAANERRLAAWLYIDRRFTASEIADDEELLSRFQALGSHLRRWLTHAAEPDRDLIKYIKDRTPRLVRKTDNTEKGRGAS